MSALRPYQAPSREAVGVVIEAIGAEDRGGRSMKVARILPALVVKAAELGELVEYDATAGGILRDGDGLVTGAWSVPVVGRGMPAQWIERLAVAITSGAIENYSEEQIVEILLRPKG